MLEKFLRNLKMWEGGMEGKWGDMNRKETFHCMFL